jgi:hypothetical protein
MSVRTVCGGVFPPGVVDAQGATARWASVAGCLFTIVDQEDVPKMVVEFALDISECIDVQLLERQQELPKLLESCGIRYIVVTGEEFNEILDPQSSLDLASLLRDRLGLASEEDDDSV